MSKKVIRRYACWHKKKSLSISPALKNRKDYRVQAHVRLTQALESRTFKTSSHGPTSVPDPPPSSAASKPGDGKLGLGTTQLFRRVSFSIVSPTLHNRLLFVV